MRRYLFALALALAACKRESPHASTVAATPAASTADVAGVVASAPSDSGRPLDSAPPVPSSSSPRPPVSDLRVVAPKALLADLPSPGAHTSAGFVGPVDRTLDAAWVQRLAAGPVARVEWHGGGVSLTFRVKFADGKKALFKPEQTLSGSNHRAEIAAYHLDRLLGFGRVAVVVGRAFPVSFLRDAVTDEKLQERLARELVTDGTRIEGALIAWHAAPLVNAEPKAGWRASMSGKAPVDDALAKRAAELSDMTVFDFLIDNTDRWSGGNVLSLGRDGPLVFLDNASALLPSRARAGASLQQDLSRVCKFRRQTVAALRADRDLAGEVAASVAKDPLGTKLEPRVVDAMRARVSALRAHVDRCERELGEGMWLGE